MEGGSKRTLSQRFQVFLDRITPLRAYRWLALILVIGVYFTRVWLLRGFYVVTYALGIYNLNLLLGFITPQIDPETEGPALPTKSDQEFKPFVRRLPEFKFWLHSIKAFLLGLVCTLFPVLDVPVFWPILLMYWLILVMVTMKKQIKHMIKYRYLPFSLGKKQTYQAGVPKSPVTTAQQFFAQDNGQFGAKNGSDSNKTSQ
eukprot:TRINITY_DN32926_c0_g2_i3.p3 TRINITY_DN32926_c0_g2~~TRINITY_DN32926_c0_g2_i3.p3  ORF type:complete len:201 (-),score=0.27 TRINITY_DN32926_c0_g2_i3:311-913(-)